MRTWDVLRATIDVLLATCLDGPQAIGLDGVASARPFDAKRVRFPHPITDGSTDAVNHSDGCVSHQGSLINSIGSNGRLLTSN